MTFSRADRERARIIRFAPAVTIKTARTEAPIQAHRTHDRSRRHRAPRRDRLGRIVRGK
jgi:hypothetical protein